jgi:hypothetical protein
MLRDGTCYRDLGLEYFARRDVPVGMKVNPDDFAGAISTRIWESVGRANWRAFTPAREFVHSLALLSRAEWDDYCKSDRRPCDLPTNPNVVYEHRAD